MILRVSPWSPTLSPLALAIHLLLMCDRQMLSRAQWYRTIF